MMALVLGAPFLHSGNRGRVFFSARKTGGGLGRVASVGSWLPQTTVRSTEIKR